MEEEKIQPVKRTRTRASKVLVSESPVFFQESDEQKNIPTKKFSPFVLLLIVGFGVVALYSGYELYKAKNVPTEIELADKRKKEILDAVGQLVLLPPGTPQFITVLDSLKVNKNEPFFRRVENGDQVLVFETEAILYRPSLKKIVAMTALVEESAKPKQTALPEKK